jgi:membrane protease YdiL (CAAX protease family)
MVISRMPCTLAILAAILSYSWILEPRGVPVAVPAAIVALVAVWSGWRWGEWGLSLEALTAASGAALRFTIAAVAVVLAAGAALGTLQQRGAVLVTFAALVPWGGAQQWLLHTIVLREARRLASPKSAVVLAALLFALVHLPNPLLTLATFAGALGWCAIYTRHPNIVPLALSHAVGTLALLSAFDDGMTGRLRIGMAYLMFDR